MVKKALTNDALNTERAESSEDGMTVLESGIEHISEKIDNLIHERTRLAIVSALAVNKGLSFNELKAIIGTSDGNLSVHARKLEDAGYLSCRKSFRNRMPHTEYRLTRAGRKRLEKYLDHMEALVSAVRGT